MLVTSSRVLMRYSTGSVSDRWMHLSFPRLASVLLCAVCSCSSERDLNTGESGSGGSTSPGATTAASDESCALAASYACPLSEVCEPLVIGDGACLSAVGAQPAQPGGWYTSDPDCYLNALIEGQPALLFMWICETPAGGGHLDWVYLLGEGTAVRKREIYASPGEPSGPTPPEPPLRMAVPPPSFFEPCLDSENREAVVECLTAWGDQDECLPGGCCPVDNAGGLPACESELPVSGADRH